MKRHALSHVTFAVAAAALFFSIPVASAQTAPSLGAAQSFAVLGGSTITNTGPTVISGNVGLSPGTAVTGFPPGLVINGAIHAANATALNAQNAATIAYNNLAAQPCTQNLTGQNLGGMTLTAGVYCFDTSAAITGTLTLNGQGNPNAVFIFKVGSTLTTASGSNVALINQASACNVFYQIGSSATLGTSSHLEGTVIALTSVTVTTGASVNGRAFARNGAVTLDSSPITGTCLSAPVCPVITLSPATLPNGTVGAVYSQQLTASGGTAPYTFSITAGALPTGLTLSATGLIAGTPTTAGTYNVTIQATDANGCFVARSYTFVIAAAGCPVITLSPATLPNGVVGTAYSQQLTASGGTAPYTFSVIAGALPTGLTLSTAGLISGTPTGAGPYSVTIRATDGSGCPGAITYAIVISAAACPVITISPATLPNGVVGTPYSQQLTASGGTAPYTYAVTAGALPAGLTLSAAGLISGTPTTAGPYNATITATDANSCPASVVYAIVITTAVPTLPEIFAIALALGLLTIGVIALRRRSPGGIK